MTKEQFDQAVINTQARFTSHFAQHEGELGFFGNYVTFNEPEQGRAYHSTVYKEIFQNLPSDIKVFFEEELKSLKSSS